MPKERNKNNRGAKLEIKVIPPNYLEMPLVEIARILGDGPLLWPGGAGRSQGSNLSTMRLRKSEAANPRP